MKSIKEEGVCCFFVDGKEEDRIWIYYNLLRTIIFNE